MVGTGKRTALSIAQEIDRVAAHGAVELFRDNLLFFLRPEVYKFHIFSDDFPVGARKI